MALPLHRNNTISTISIDLDDTLWDNAPVLEYAETQLYYWLEKNAPLLTESFSILDFDRHRKVTAVQNPGIKHDLTRLRYESLMSLAKEKGYHERLVADAMEVFLQARNNVSLYADAVPALKQLSARFKLIAVSNGNADIKRIGIDRYFTLSISPSETGVSKPDPAVFEIILKRMEIMPDMLLHIGDEPKTDILGAQNAGIRNIWINRDNKKWPDAFSAPDATIASLSGIMSVIEGFI